MPAFDVAELRFPYWRDSICLGFIQQGYKPFLARILADPAAAFLARAVRSSVVIVATAFFPPALQPILPPRLPISAMTSEMVFLSMVSMVHKTVCMLNYLHVKA